MKFSGLAVLALMLIFVPKGFADTVHLETGGHLLGQTPLNVGQQISFGFSLANDTDVTSLTFGLAPVLGGTYSLTITGPGGATFAAQPGLFLAGSYEVTFQGLTCSGFCTIAPAFLDYYAPATYTEIGGTVIPGPGVGNGIGWDLVGNTVDNTVPEPATAALVGTGLIAAFSGIRRRLRLAA